MNLSTLRFGNVSLIDDIWHDGISWRYRIEAPDGSEVASGSCETKGDADAAVQSAYTYRAVLRARVGR